MRLKEIEKRLAEIKEDIQKRGAELTPDEVSAYETESNDLLSERKAILEANEKRQKMLNSIADSDIGNTIDEGSQERKAKKEERSHAEIGGDLLEKRSVLVSSGDIILPSHTSNKINDTFNPVSSFVDASATEHVKGGESYEEGYVISYGEGDVTEEGGLAALAETKFGAAKIDKVKITAYAEISKEMKKLPKADYAKKVFRGIGIAIKKKMTVLGIHGQGLANQFRGLFYNPVAEDERVINPDSDIVISEINTDTLDEIVFNYGGEEAVEGESECTLLLNKNDLRAFSRLRTTDGKKYHKIVKKGNYGTIDDVNYILVSACPAFSKNTTTDDTYCMAYGHIKNYKFVVFSDTEIQESSDYKFREGMIGIRGEVYVGANVIAHNGFLRVKKKASTIGDIIFESLEGAVSGKTLINITSFVSPNLTLKYKTGASLTAPIFDQVCTTGWTAWNGTDEITATNGEQIMIAAVDESNKCKAFGTTTIVAKV